MDLRWTWCELPPSHCRGGYYPPAQCKPSKSNHVGRIRIYVQHFPIQPNTRKPKPGGRLIASPTVAGHSFLLRRNDTGRYPGVWRIQTAPVRHCLRALPAKLQFAAMLSQTDMHINIRKLAPKSPESLWFWGFCYFVHMGFVQKAYKSHFCAERSQTQPAGLFRNLWYTHIRRRENRRPKDNKRSCL